MEYIAVLNYSQNFGEPIPEDSLHFIKHYPTDFILFRLSQINAILFREEKLSKQNERILMNVIFSGLPQADDELKRLIRNANLNNQTFFSAPAISLMIKSSLENFVEQVPDRYINPIQFARDLLTTILIFNEIYYAVLDGLNFESFRGIGILQLIQQNFIRGNLYMKLITSLKFAFISKFLDTHEYLRKEAIEFCKYFEIGNPWLFGKFFLDLVVFYSKDELEPITLIDQSVFPPKLIEDFTLDKEGMRGRNSISLTMDVIPAPFYLYDGKTPIILDYNFFQFAIDQGFFYSLFYRSSLKNNEKFKDHNVFNSYISLNFFERYLVRTYLQKIYCRKNQKFIATEKYQDFIIKTSSNTIVIFEVKMAALHAKTLEGMDFDLFKVFIDKNFLSEKSLGTKNKGVSQLKRQLAHLSDTESELRDLLDSGPASRLNVYPVIVYSDGNLDMAGVNKYINENSETMMAPFRKSFQSLKPVTMMNVNTFIEYLSILKASPTALTDLINGYHKNTNSLAKQYEASKSPTGYMKMNKSFTSYLANKLSGNHLDKNLAEMTKSFDLNIVNFGKD